MKNKYSVLLTALVMLTILYLTLQTKNQTLSLTYWFQEKLSFLTNRIPWLGSTKNFRQAAHLPEYLLLGIAAGWMFLHQKYSIPKTLLFCLAFSFSDQLLKSWLPTREFCGMDMVFDFAGYCLGMLLVHFVHRARKQFG